MGQHLGDLGGRKHQKPGRPWPLCEHCTVPQGVEQCPRIYVLLRPQGVLSFGNRVVADVMKMWCYRNRGAPHPVTDVLGRRGQRRDGHRDEAARRARRRPRHPPAGLGGPSRWTPVRWEGHCPASEPVPQDCARIHFCGVKPPVGAIVCGSLRTLMQTPRPFLTLGSWRP